MEREPKINNWSDWESYLAYNLAMDDSEPKGIRDSAKRVYEKRYGNVVDGFGANPISAYSRWQMETVQPIVGNTLRAWVVYLGWLIGFK
jgi:hypothetical protein